jgi:hypothetical protein
MSVTAVISLMSKTSVLTLTSDMSHNCGNCDNCDNCDTYFSSLFYFYRHQSPKQCLHEGRLLLPQDLVRGAHRDQEGPQAGADPGATESGQNPEDPAGVEGSRGEEGRAEEGAHLCGQDHF